MKKALFPFTDIILLLLALGILPTLSFASQVDPAIIGVWESDNDGDLDVWYICPEGTTVIQYDDRCYTLGKITTSGQMITIDFLSDNCGPLDDEIVTVPYSVDATSFSIDWGDVGGEVPAVKISGCGDKDGDPTFPLSSIFLLLLE